MKALAELSDYVKSPMIEAGLTKADIRALSNHLGLQTWNKQSAACLASRIPYGMTLTAERLTQIDKAEQVIAPFITGSLRVRYHGDLARIEVADDEIPVILAHRTDIISALRRLGFTYVTVDLGGYEMGSLNEVLEKGEDAHESHTKVKDEMLQRFQDQYGIMKPALHYKSPFELLVAVVLSAQCTDERVNIVTAGMFPKYNRPEK